MRITGYCFGIFALTILILFLIWDVENAKHERAVQYVNTHRGQRTENDPWGNLYKVDKEQGEGFLQVTIKSAGKDGKLGTKDDIVGGYRQTISIEILSQ